MYKNHKLLCIVLSFLLITCLIPISVYSQEQESFEHGWYEIGYTSVGDASAQCSRLFKRPITVPTGLPPVTFTHQFARCSNLFGQSNDEFEIEYVNKHTGLKHYSITMRPLTHKITINKQTIKGEYKLHDQTKAILFSINSQSSLDTLVFEKNDWQYMLMLDRRGLVRNTGEVLVQVANTLKEKEKK